MAKPFYRKIISKASDLVHDIEECHSSDAVLHAKNLIDLLIFYSLKFLGSPDSLRFERNVTDEQKLEFLLDRDIISERIFDNCLNTKGLRNPIEHVFTYPNEFFAKGSALSALELYYALQPRFDLPQITPMDTLAVKLGVQPMMLLHIAASRYIPVPEMKQLLQVLHNILEKYAGPYIVIMDFPPGTIHPNGLPANGITLEKKVNYQSGLLEELKKYDFVQNIEWAGLEIFEQLPHVDTYDKEKFPHLFNK